MISLAVLRELYDYNYWARDRQFAACAELSPEQFTRPLGGSFASLRDTLVHMVWGEWLWLERWLGRTPGAFPLEAEFPTANAIQQRWREVERDMRRYLAGLTEADLAGTLTYLNRRGERWSYPLWRTLVHIVNHQTYHRGQVTTLLRQLGAAAPAVDFLVAHDMEFRLSADAGKG